uniref:Uncharacterized protein gs79 n=1 Tax=Homo sapiens TaxID=9606 RepID=Q96S03_HUMAN|nr:unknown [Homo sapiens]
MKHIGQWVALTEQPSGMCRPGSCRPRVWPRELNFLTTLSPEVSCPLRTIDECFVVKKKKKKTKPKPVIFPKVNVSALCAPRVWSDRAGRVTKPLTVSGQACWGRSWAPAFVVLSSNPRKASEGETITQAWSCAGDPATPSVLSTETVTQTWSCAGDPATLSALSTETVTQTWSCAGDPATPSVLSAETVA